MPVTPLPPKPDLGKLKDTAGLLRDLVRSGVRGAIDLVRDHHPRLTDLVAGSTEAAGFKLADAQLTIARHHGLASWPALRRHVEGINELTRSPHRQPVGEVGETEAARADEFLRLACLTYGADDPSRPRRAAALSAEHPQLATYSVWTMAAAGGHAALAAALRADPTATDRRGGPFGWEPLLYAAYSRLPVSDRDHDTYEAARVLLEAGADPNAGYLWEAECAFTALTGAFGRGEGSQPPHPRSMDLARLLLAAGADANDSQAIYNCGPGDLARDDTIWLELLLDHGLGQGDGGPWKRRLGGRGPSPVELIADALQHAAEAGLTNRVRLLLDRGADPNRRATHPLYRGRTPYVGAVLHGNLEIADWLAAAGADVAGVDAAATLVGRCLAGDRTVATMSGELAEVRERHPDLIARAAELQRPGAIRLLVDLGWDVNQRGRATALHEAALRGDLELVELLISLGADVNIRDSEHDATAAGWADYGGHPAVVEILLSLETPA